MERRRVRAAAGGGRCGGGGGGEPNGSQPIGPMAILMRTSRAVYVETQPVCCRRGSTSSAVWAMFLCKLAGLLLRSGACDMTV